MLFHKEGFHLLRCRTACLHWSAVGRIFGCQQISHCESLWITVDSAAISSYSLLNNFVVLGQIDAKSRAWMSWLLGWLYAGDQAVESQHRRPDGCRSDDRKGTGGFFLETNLSPGSFIFIAHLTNTAGAHLSFNSLVYNLNLQWVTVSTSFHSHTSR